MSRQVFREMISVKRKANNVDSLIAHASIRHNISQYATSTEAMQSNWTHSSSLCALSSSRRHRITVPLCCHRKFGTVALVVMSWSGIKCIFYSFSFARMTQLAVGISCYPPVFLYSKILYHPCSRFHRREWETQHFVIWLLAINYFVLLNRKLCI